MSLSLYIYLGLYTTYTFTTYGFCSASPFFQLINFRQSLQERTFGDCFSRFITHTAGGRMGTNERTLTNTPKNEPKTNKQTRRIAIHPDGGNNNVFASIYVRNLVVALWYAVESIQSTKPGTGDGTGAIIVTAMKYCTHA